jgi:hypothetical protein
LDEWLTKVREAVAEAAGLSVDELNLDHDSEVVLLDLARIAAHESGERTNAPLLCYLLGRAQRGVTLDVLADAVKRVSSPR